MRTVYANNMLSKLENTSNFTIYDKSNFKSRELYTTALIMLHKIQIHKIYLFYFQYFFYF